MAQLRHPINFEEVIGNVKNAYIGYEYEEKKFLSDYKDLHKQKNLQIIIGPEGGFTEEEIEKAMACGFRTLSLGPRILKSDPATVSACTLMQYLYGDLG